MVFLSFRLLLILFLLVLFVLLLPLLLFISVPTVALLVAPCNV